MIQSFVDSYGNEKEDIQKTVIILPYDSTMLENYLQYEQFARYVTKEISTKNYQVVGQIDSANLVIFIKYGTSDKELFERDVYLPIYGQTGNAVYTTFTNKDLRFYPGAIIQNSLSQTFRNPEYGISGSAPYKTSEYFYSHYLIISAFNKLTMATDFKRSLKWKVISKIETQDRDIRRQFPYLVISAGQFMGKDSKQELLIQTPKNDIKVKWLTEDLDNSFLLIQNNSSEQPIEEIPVSEEERKIQLNSAGKTIKDFKRISSIENVKAGDFVMFKSEFGELVFGLVQNAEFASEITILTFPSKGNRLGIKCRLSELYSLSN